MGEKELQQHEPVHCVVVDGMVIYSGPDWVRAFLEAAHNRDHKSVVHTIDGKVGARWWPILGETDSISNDEERLNQFS